MLLISTASAQRQMEPLGRGVLALRTGSSQAYIGWRLFATDPKDIAFNVYRSQSGGPWQKLNLSPQTATTDYLDTGATLSQSNAWRVVPVIGGVEQSPSAAAQLPANAPVRQYLPIPMQPVIGGANPPYDVKFCWVGDFDGDGEYDFLVDRLSTTANVRQYLQAYKRDGTFLWQMDMGPNSTLTSGNSTIVYEPSSSAISVGDKDNVTVYDLDGDGKAEVIVRTANGVVFGNGVTKAGGVNNNVQFLSVIDGLTGAEKASAVVPNPYIDNGPLNSHAGILYCDGVHPYVLLEGENRVDDDAFQRISTAWTYQNGVLSQRWSHVGGPGENTSVGHQLRQGDVNRDGRDELLMIGAALSQTSDSATNVTVLYQTDLQHGDRYHLTDIDPERPGLEIYSIQQYNQTLLATSLADASSGQFIKKWYAPTTVDVGRGIALDMDPRYRGCEMYSTQPGTFNSKGDQIWPANLWAPEGIWWDADLVREFEDGAGSGALTPVINKYNTTTHTNERIYTIYNEDGGVHQAFGGRAAFWGDIMGDWREEVVLVANFATNASVTNDVPEIRIYTTKIAATNRVYCLMQNPTYRSQCTYKGYYQASYVDYYLGIDMPEPPIPPVSDAKIVWRGGGANIWDTSTANWFTNNLWISNFTATVFNPGDSVLFDLTGSNQTAVTLAGTLAPGAVRVHSPKDYTFSGSGELSGSMRLSKAGSGTLTLTGTNTYTGETEIAEGAFRVEGSLPNSPVIVRGPVWLDARISGGGTLGSSVTIHEGGGVSPGQGVDAAGIITLTSNLALRGRTFSDFDLSDDPTGTLKTNDVLIVGGSLTLQGTNTLVIHKLDATLSPGVYPLINYSGSLTGNLNNLTLKGLEGLPCNLTNPPGQIALVIKSTRAPVALSWTGGQNSNTWDLLTTSNFLNGATKDHFVPADSVNFDSIGTSNLTVNLSGALQPAAMDVNSSANYTLVGSGTIIGAGGLTKSGSGTLTVNAMNSSFTGPTRVLGGTLVVPELDAVGFPSPLGNPNANPSNLVLFGNTALRVTGESYTDRGINLPSGVASLDITNATDQLTMAGLINGIGTLQKLGGGTLALVGSKTYSGGTIIKAGNVSLGGDTANEFGLGSGAVTLDGGSLTMYNDDGSYNHSYWNVIVPSGSTGTLYADGRCYLHGTLTGNGTFNFRVNYVRTELNGNWSGFTGQINVLTSDGAGDFRINNLAGYASSTINLSAGIYAYHIDGSAVSIGALAGSPGSYLSGTPWTIGAKNTDATFAGNIAGNSITKVGAGTWTLTGSNYYSGPTIISGGTLMVNGNNASAAGTITVNASGRLAGTGIVGGNVTIQNGGALAAGSNAIGTLTFNGNLTLNSGSTTLVEVNKNTGAKDLLDAAGTLNYGGALVVTNLAGTFTAGNSYKLFDAAIYNGSFSSSNLPPLTAGLVWDLSLLNSSGTISVGTAPSVGPQVLTWKGDGIGNRWDLGVSPNWLTPSNSPSPFFNADAVTFDDSGSNNTAIILTTAVQPGSVTVNAAKDFTFAGPGSIAGTNALLKSGSGKLSLAVPATHSGGTTIAAGTLELLNLTGGLAHRWSFNNTLADSVGAQTAMLVNVGANNASLTASTVVMAGGARTNSDYIDLGDGLLPKDGTPMTIELWATTHSVQNWSRIFDFGASTTENMFMSWTRASALASDRVEWTDAGGTNTVNDSNQPYSTNVEYHIAMVIHPGAGTGGTTRVTWFRSPSTNGTLGAARGTFDTANTLTSLLDTNCWLGYSQWPDNAANASYNEVRLWNRALTAADLQLLHNAGPDATLLGNLPNSSTLNLSGASGKLDNLSGQMQTVGTLTGVAGSEVKLTSGGLAAGGNNSSTTFSGAFSGTNGLTKTGTGTLTLAGNNIHVGATLVSAGSLLFNGNNATATGTVTVSAGATLGGTGLVGGATTIQPGGTLSPGSSIGTLTFNGGLTLNGLTFMEISHSPLTNDTLVKVGTLNYAGALEVTNTSGTLVAGDKFNLFNAAGYAGAFGATTLPPLPAGLLWNASKLNVSGTLWVVSTDPPSLSPPATAGGNFTFGGTGGTPGWDYYVLSATDITLPTGSWDRIATNQFDASGNCEVIVPLDPELPKRFYRLQVP